jgi:hypothetical protein
MYLNRHQSVVTCLAYFDFAIGNLVIYVYHSCKCLMFG